MIVAASGTITDAFTTQDTTGAATDADSTPTGTLYRNGASTAVTVTVTNLATGLYGISATLPGYTAGDQLQVVIAATIGGTAAKGVVWRGVVKPPVDAPTKAELDAGLDGLNDASADDVLAAGDIDGYSLEESQKLILATLTGKLSGAGTDTVTIQAADDSKARITATVDADGNRTAVTLDGAG